MERHIMVRVLRRAEDFGLLFSFLALLLVAWYVAWLRWLSAFPASTFSRFFDLPPWVCWPRVAAWLLTILGVEIVWSAFSLGAIFRAKRGAAATIDADRVVVSTG